MVTASIVLYHNDENVLSDAIKSFLDTPIEKHLYLIDNSRDDVLRKFSGPAEVTYIKAGENLGFGRGHNLILDRLNENSDYHLILNPDAYFGIDVLPLLTEHLRIEDSIGLIAPKILYPNGEFQKSIRRFPKIQDLIIRRVPGMRYLFRKTYERGNYLDKKLESPMVVDAVSGCFQLFKTEVFVKVEGFDTRYFMYMEDLDICRKVHQSGYRVLYYPKTKVYHRSEYGSKKSIKLLTAHLKSILKYFIKWSFK